MVSRRILLAGSVSLLVAGSILTPIAVFAAKAEIFKDEKTGIAINGFDSVAYFTQGMPVEGVEQYSFKWSSAVWFFSSDENKSLFMENPEKYAPQYGGYCAFAVSRGYTAPTVPEAWTIYEDKLYLNFSLSVRKRWRKDIEKNIEKADENWPDVLK
ncbi:MAG: YHS domain-containing protein [Devosiaceae bacterium]|nr:YHS domain-containing protein [Devosiaceae bacterium]